MFDAISHFHNHELVSSQEIDEDQGRCKAPRRIIGLCALGDGPVDLFRVAGCVIEPLELYDLGIGLSWPEQHGEGFEVDDVTQIVLADISHQGFYRWLFIHRVV